MAGVTPRQIYRALIAAGATKLQAIGIMANGINESTLNPEARGDYVGGVPTSFGFVQQNGSQYAGLVTGNPQKDLGAQIRVLAQNGGFRAASGQTAGQAAGNFAANYERCQGCQPGGAQYNARVANAAVVAGWVQSDKWPAASPGASSAAGTSNGSSSSSTSSDPDCAFSIGGQHIGIVFGHGPSLPSTCLVKRATIRHLVGGGLMAGGFFVLLPGVVIILVYGFRASGAARAVAQVGSVLPGPAGRAAGAYQVTEREPLGGQMGGTRTVRYRARRRPAREAEA